MNLEEYRKNFSGELKTFLTSQAGTGLMQAIASTRPLFKTDSSPHAHHESAGAVRGHDQVFNLIFLLSRPPQQNQEVAMDYGVPEKQKEE